MIGFCSAELHAGQAQDSFPLVKLATDVVKMHRGETLAGFYAITIDAKRWESLTTDSDLGPFLKLKQSQPDLSVVLVLRNSKRDPAYCVYFHGQNPSGFAEVSPKPSGKMTDEDVRKSYQDVARQTVKPTGEELYFTDVSLTTDDGSPMPAVKILSGGTK
jgi:hypothetical protein